MAVTFKHKTIITCLSLICSSFANNSNFQVFDNNVTADINGTVSNQNYMTTKVGLDGQILFVNNIWLHVNADTALSYSVMVNSDSNIAKLLNNFSGTDYSGQIGYAFQLGNRWNLIPHVGFGYSNLLLAFNEDSIQQFIIANPSFNYSIGTKTELILIPNKLKLATDINYIFSGHAAVMPNDNTTDDKLGHQSYTINTIQIRPELQWNITKKFTIIGYYQFATLFGGTFNAVNIYYPQIGVSSSQLIRNNEVQNTVGLNFGIPF